MDPKHQTMHHFLSKLNPNPLFSALINTTLPFTLLEILGISIIILEAFFIFHTWQKPIFHFLFLFTFFLFFLLSTFISKPYPVYLVDYSCLKPPCYCRVPFSVFLENSSLLGLYDTKSLAFMAKVLAYSGQGQETCLPPSLHYIPPKTNYQESIKEVHMVLFPVMEDLLSKTKLSPLDIDILIVNCSGFCPSPSLTSIVINKFSMRSDIKSYSLSGMGCSAGILGIDLAQNLLKVHKNSNAIVLSTEILSTGWYPGNEKSKLVLNCLFRMGSAAILLTNKTEAKNTSKYKLFHRLRTQGAFNDKAYLLAIREEDKNGILGVSIRGDLEESAGETLRSHIKLLGSSILPFSEKFRHIISTIRTKEIYVPNFKTVIQHFCLPVTGRPAAIKIAKGLKLGERDMEAALMTMHRFGHQSSSAVWYELAYMEAKGRVMKGDTVWQLGMGTGPKCVSVVWECIRPIVGEAKNGPWADCIHRYPILAVDQDL